MKTKKKIKKTLKHKNIKTKKVAKKLAPKKITKKLAKKKVVKKVVKKKAVKKVAKAKPKLTKKLGDVTHFYGGISVAIIKCVEPIKVGQKVRMKGATTDFVCSIESIQYEHAPLEESKSGQEVGIKVSDKVREGDEVFFVE